MRLCSILCCCALQPNVAPALGPTQDSDPAAAAQVNAALPGVLAKATGNSAIVNGLPIAFYSPLHKNRAAFMRAKAAKESNPAPAVPSPSHSPPGSEVSATDEAESKMTHSPSAPSPLPASPVPVVMPRVSLHAARHLDRSQFRPQTPHDYPDAM